jgi:hypothetical protein
MIDPVAGPMTLAPPPVGALAETVQTTRRVPTADGVELVVRTVSPGDAAELAALYDRLPLDDRRLRFFGFYRPPTAFFEKMAAVDGRDGYRLVAEMNGHLVGEAGYTTLPDGDGEFAIVVDREWRGWLGPYLFDALSEDAARLGLPNLEGDILVENARMMALVRSRGYVTMDHQDCSTIRVLVACGRRMPSWPPATTGYRLLVEAKGGRWRHEDEVRRAGIDVLVCPGPFGRRTRRCPAVSGEPCPLATLADGALVMLPDDERERMVAAHRRVHEDLPLLTEEEAAELADI